MNQFLQKAKRDIALAYPEVNVRTLKLAGQGDFARAFTVNDELMVLFAINPEGSVFLTREAALLPHIVREIDLPIPDITHTGRYGDKDYTFICYPRISGIPLSAKHFFDSSQDDQHRFAKTISHFLHQLHSFDLDKARHAGVEERDYRENNTRYLKKSRELIYPLVEQDIQHHVEKIFEENAEPDFSPVLMHDDLSAEHILFDSDRCQITGIIDFSDMIIGDRIEDLMYLYDDYGIKFFSVFLDYYYQGDRRPLLEKLHFYHERHTIARILWAIEHRYQPGIDFRLKELVELVEMSASPAWKNIVD